MSNASIYPPNNNFNGWLKYLPFERKTWKQLIADAEIPDEAKALIREVVQQSRLMRFEKIEIIQDLIGHFLDGQLAGHSYPQLVDEFGDPSVTATLIRRSKLRNRPVMLRALQIFGWVFFGIFATYLGIYAYFHAAKPSINHDYLADLNALNADVKASDKAWPIYREQWLEFDFSHSGKFNREVMDQFYVPNPEEHDKPFPSKVLVSPSHEKWPEAIAELEKLTPLLDAFREGASKPRLGFEVQVDPNNYSDEDFKALYSPRSREEMAKAVDPEDPLDGGNLIGILLPHVQQFRQIARLLTVDTRWAIEQGDTDRIVRNFETYLGLSSHAADTNVLVGSLVGFAISGIGFDNLEEALQENPELFTDQQLERMIARLGETSYTEMTKIAGERAMIFDIIQRIYSDNGKGNGRVTPEGLELGLKLAAAYNNQVDYYSDNLTTSRVIEFAKSAMAPVSMFIVADRKATSEKADQLLNDFQMRLEQPNWQRSESDFEEFLENNQTKYFILAQLMPAIDAVINAADRMTARQEGILTALAAHRYYLANQQWPTDVMSLSPDYIAELPVDVMTGQIINLTADEKGPIVYSVGIDQDDDGGVQMVDQRGNLVPAAHWVTGDGDGDLIVWPQTRFNGKGPAKN